MSIFATSSKYCKPYLLIITFILTTFFIKAQTDSLLPDINMQTFDEDAFDTTLFTENKQMISASRSEKQLRDLPLSVYIITQKDIIENGYISLVDALQEVPGIRISQPGSALEGETFLMRGLLGNYYCKLLINGQTIQPSVVSGMPIGEQIPIRQAERIEIIFGPASAVYGVDAMSGIINIVTKQNNKNHSAQADMMVGNNGYNLQNINLNGLIGKNQHIIFYNLYAGISQQNDMNIKYDLVNNYNPLNYKDIEYMENADFYEGYSLSSPKMGNMPIKNEYYGGLISYKNISVEYQHMYRQMHSAVGKAPYLYKYSDSEVFYGEYINRVSLRYQKKWKNITLYSSASYLRYNLNENSRNHITYDVSYADGYSYLYAASDDINTENYLAWNPKKNIELIAGFSYQKSGNLPMTADLTEPFNPDLYKFFSTNVDYTHPYFNNFGINPMVFYDFGTFMQLYYQYKKFSFLGGLRYNYHSLFNTSINPRIGVQYAFSSKWQLKINYGKAFRAPSTYYRYFSQAFKLNNTFFADIEYAHVPNPDLKPELFESIELEVNCKPNNNIFCKINTFYNLTNNFMTRIYIPLNKDLYPDGTPFYYEANTRTFANSDETNAELLGFQAYASIKNPIPVFKNKFTVCFTNTHAKESFSADSIVNNMRLIPKYTLKMKYSFTPVSIVSFYVFYNWVSDFYRRYTPYAACFDAEKYPRYKNKGYNTFDFGINVKITDKLLGYIKIKNAFDAHYGGIGAYGHKTDLWYNPQYGRQFRLGINYNISK